MTPWSGPEAPITPHQRSPAHPCRPRSPTQNARIPAAANGASHGPRTTAKGRDGEAVTTRAFPTPTKPSSSVSSHNPPNTPNRKGPRRRSRHDPRISHPNEAQIIRVVLDLPNTPNRKGPRRRSRRGPRNTRVSEAWIIRVETHAPNTPNRKGPRRRSRRGPRTSHPNEAWIPRIKHNHSKKTPQTPKT